MNIGKTEPNNTYTTKNYTEQGGEIIHIGGVLMIDPGGSIEGIQIPVQAEGQEDSEATTIAALKEDFNSLLKKLRKAGVIANTRNVDIT